MATDALIRLLPSTCGERRMMDERAAMQETVASWTPPLSANGDSVHCPVSHPTVRKRTARLPPTADLSVHIPRFLYTVSPLSLSANLAKTTPVDQFEPNSTYDQVSHRGTGRLFPKAVVR
jgi:hypothetical protein